MTRLAVYFNAQRILCRQVTSIIGGGWRLSLPSARLLPYRASKPHPFARAEPVEIVALCDQHLLQTVSTVSSPGGGGECPFSGAGSVQALAATFPGNQSIPIGLSIRLRPQRDRRAQAILQNRFVACRTVGNGAWSALVTSGFGATFSLCGLANLKTEFTARSIRRLGSAVARTIGK